jgi:hypothetical protein
MNSRRLMSGWVSATVITAAAMGLTSGFSTLATAQTQSTQTQSTLATAQTQSALAAVQTESKPVMIGNNDAIFVDGTTFKVTPGKSKDDAASQIKTSDAQELSQGAIVFRSGEKLYLVDAPPRQAVGIDGGHGPQSDSFTAARDYYSITSWTRTGVPPRAHRGVSD